MRRFINDGQLPYPDAVRIEEMVNYFHYDYESPKGKHPFSVNTEVANSPWNPKHKLVHIGLQGKKLGYDNLAASNLVFLLDVSGSMSDQNKLPLLKKSLNLLLDEMGEHDKVAVVVYAGAAGVVLESTPATQKAKIMSALDNLEAGGSTAGGEGIQLAYDIAKQNLITNGNNRIILATDGDFNVGTSSTSELVRLVEEKRKDGIYLTICGFGMGNYKDGRMEQISNAGNGNYFYIDNIREAQKVFVTEMRATLFTIAKDVKIQVEFNPKQVQAYRLIGYENRKLNREDFDDDTKDAGELGAGHTVTALYEIIPRGVESDLFQPASGLKYQRTQTTDAAGSDELMTVKLRYKKPSEDTSILLSTVINNANGKWENTSENFRFSAAVAEFGMLLRDSELKGTASYNQVVSMANGAKGKDEEGYRSEFVQLVRSGMLLAEN
jgi:Ca-activated chloride channel family protein